MFKNKAIIEFGVIGLGRFGYALAKSLAEAGKEVLVLDSNEKKIKDIRNYIDEAFIVESLDRETLEQAGIQNCNTVIVCIGEAIDVSILTTLNVISMGVPRVISKATSYEQGKVLEKLGAEVIYPEHDMAIRLANGLISASILESIELRNEMIVTEFKLTSKISGKSIKEIDLPKKFKLNIIALEQGGNTTVNIDSNISLNEDDKIVVIGKKNDTKNFRQYLTE